MSKSARVLLIINVWFINQLMKTYKAIGVDDIAIELIRNSSTEIQDKLFKLVNDKYIYIYYGKDPKRL